jgi:peroxiredoxin
MQLKRASKLPQRIVALLLIALAGQACAQSPLNKKAPQFSRADLRGGTVSLGAYRGKVVVLNFWATWCAPCIEEMPVFSRWQRRYGAQGLQVIGVSMDDDAAAPSHIVERLRIHYPVAMGDAKLGNLYGGVEGLPLTLLIDRNGIVRNQFSGIADMKAIEKQMRELLSAQ